MPESNAASTAAVAGVPAWAQAVAAGIHAAGSRDIVYVPDNPMSHVLRTLAARHPDIRTTVATREEEAFGVAAGLYLGGRRPTVMLQSSGLGNSLNAIGTLVVPYQMPVLIIISMRGDAGEWNWAQVPMGRLVRPALDALGIQHLTIERPEDADRTIVAAGALAFGARVPVACLLPRRLTVPLPPSGQRPAARTAGPRAERSEPYGASE